MVDPSRVHMRGQFITAGGGKATIVKDPSAIKKGMFMKIDAQPPRQHFISQTDAIQLLAARLRDVRKALEAPIGGKAKRW